jgi:hypothetical protein
VRSSCVAGVDLYGRELLAVDGTRIKAVNNKDRNFTRTSLQDFIRAADERIDDYSRQLDEGDIEEGGTGGACTKNLAEKIAALRQKRGRYGAMPAELERTGENQISLTDPDSRAMAARDDRVVTAGVLRQKCSNAAETSFGALSPPAEAISTRICTVTDKDVTSRS